MSGKKNNKTNPDFESIFSTNVWAERRAFLRTAASSGFLALPILDIMLNSHGEAYAAGGKINPKFITMFCGMATTGTDLKLADLPLVPSKVGVGYDAMSKALHPIGQRSLQNKVSTISNLVVPTVSGKVKTGDGKTAGGWKVPGDAGWHEYGAAPIFLGRSMNKSRVVSGSSSLVSADHIAAEHLKSEILNLAVQGESYGNGGKKGPGRGVITWRNTGYKEGIRPDIHPQQVYDKYIKGGLTGNGNSSGGNSTSTGPSLADKKRSSILDLVLDDSKRLKNKLGRNDQLKIDQHMSAVSDIKRKIDSFDPGGGSVDSTKCSEFTDFKGYNAGNGNLEDKRAELMNDLMALALSCGTHDVATMAISYTESFMNGSNLKNFGVNRKLHSITHDPSLEALNKGIAWHVDIYADLLQKLNTINVGGGTLLDHSMATFQCEGSRGYDYNKDKGGLNIHSGENATALFAGGGALGIKQGQHIRSNREHPAKVFITALNAIGAGNRLGEITGGIPGLT